MTAAFLRRRLLPLLALLLALVCAFSVWRVYAISRLLPDQLAAERWQGGGERRFAEISCFLPGGVSLTRDDIRSFRNEMGKKLKAASLDLQAEPGLYTDAWCGFGSVKVSAGGRSGECRVIAVGGSFFDFHPVHLLSGNYLREEDVMEDRILLDRETAWLLFGGTELTGMSFSVNGTPFVAAGVYAHADDAFSRLALGDGMSIYMSYEAFQRLYPDTAAISCYELVSAEPVKGFAYSAVQEKFPVKGTEFAACSTRFQPDRLWKLVRSQSARSMHTGSAVYPWWENAARAAEDRAAAWLLTAVLTGSIPLALLLYAAIRLSVRGKRKLEEDILPETKERMEEAVRVRQRRRWEKRHPDSR